MKAVLRGLHSPDVDDLRSWEPEDESWRLLVQALLGPDNGPGEESFDFVVCSPKVVTSAAAEDGHWWSGHTLVLERWDYSKLEAAVMNLLAHCDGEEWGALAEQLARNMDWEFTNYRPR